MKIALLGGLSSIHTIRWANVFAERGHNVHVITSKSHCKAIHNISTSVKVDVLPFSSPHGYYMNVGVLKKLLAKISPDVLNAHYASGYGTLGRLCGFHPYVLSVWGSDVFDFPYQSRYHMSIIKKNLLAPDLVCSTSNIMVKQTKSLCPEISKVSVTPFGVDTDVFKPLTEFRDPHFLTVGTVKALYHKYGIDILLNTFALVKTEMLKKGLDINLRLMIAGDGPDMSKLQKLARHLNIATQCEWLGKVPHGEVPEILNKFDIYVALSRLDSESFGVAVLEASACGLPVLVSNAGGLPEVVADNETGFIVPKEHYEVAADALTKLLLDFNLRKKMGKSGVDFVRKNYEWNSCVITMEEQLLSVCKG